MFLTASSSLLFNQTQQWKVYHFPWGNYLHLVKDFSPGQFQFFPAYSFPLFLILCYCSQHPFVACFVGHSPARILQVHVSFLVLYPRKLYSAFSSFPKGSSSGPIDLEKSSDFFQGVFSIDFPPTSTLSCFAVLQKYTEAHTWTSVLILWKQQDKKIEQIKELHHLYHTSP